MGVPHRLPAVQRLFAAMVAVAMWSTSGSPQHVHAYADHDHPDHHHGPASHRHAAVAPSHAHASDETTRLEGCDPGEHAVALVFTGVAPHAVHVPVAVTIGTLIVTPPEDAWRHVTPSDVRAHSPPRLTDAPLRAPPVAHLA
jgi:hypothetical protein